MSKILENAVAANEVEIEVPDSDVDLIFTKLSEHKIATFSECDENGEIIEGSPVVQAIFVDGNSTYESQWQTPFENSNPEHKLPTLMAGIQSGQIIEAVGGILATNEFVDVNKITQTINNTIKVLDPVTGKLKETAEGLVGKTNFTKVNSQQIFLSSASVRKSITIFLIAIYDAKKEVEDKIKQLEAWVLPRELSKTGIAENIASNGWGGLFPSTIPPYISLKIHGKRYAPFIIDSVNSSIDAPIDKDGNRLSLSVELTMLSRTAWDAKDVFNLYGN